MWEIIKSLFRYSFKNFASLIMLTTLISVSSGVSTCMMMLSSNLKRSYNRLIDQGNLNNIVINELYSTSYEANSGISGEEAKKKNEEEFKKELVNLIGEDSFRTFKALDFTGSSSGYVYKIVSTSYDEKIDKTVIYDGHNVLPETFNFEKIIDDAKWSLDSLINKRARRLLAFLATKTSWTSNENFTNDAREILTVTDVNSNDFDPKNWVNKNNELAKKMKTWLDDTSKNYVRPVSKGYRLSLDISGTVPIVGQIDNLSSFAVVVPNYILEKQNKSILPNSIYEQLKSYNSLNTNSSEAYDYNYSNFNNEYINQTTLMSFINSIDNKYKIKVDNIDYLIVGEGISPSFMYPVYSLERQTPNIDTEILIYANEAGYQLAYDSARSSPVETYIVAKVNEKKLSFYLDKINKIAQKYMAWPSNMKAAYSIYDTSNSLSPVALRLSFLPQLVNSQVIIGNLLTIFIAILVALIFIFSIKKYINDNRASLGALRANGIKKRWIMWCMPLLSLFPALVGGLLGYTFAQFSQPLFLNLYSFYWTIPTTLTTFSPLLFCCWVFIPFIIMGLISIISTYFLLKGNTNNLLNESNRFQATWLSKKASTLFGKKNVLLKFRTSIAFSSLSKLIMIAIMFSLFTTAISSGLAINNKFKYTQTKTFENKNYNFSIDLLTPTIQGGGYFRQQKDFPGRPITNNNNEVLNYSIGMSDSNYKSVRFQHGNLLLYSNNSIENSDERLKTDNSDSPIGQTLLLHIPSINDSTWQKNDFLYLKNRVQMPSVLNAEVGVSGIAATNPWDIAKNLAPANQMTLSNNLTKKLWTKILDDTNIYFNETNLKKYIPSNSDYNDAVKKMANKPLSEIVTSQYNFIEKAYPVDSDGNQVNEPLEPSPDTIEKYNDEGKIIEQYKVNKSSFKVTPLGTKLKSQFILIMLTLLNLSTKNFNFDYSNMSQTDIDKIEYAKGYKNLFFASYYQYIPMENNDETYTYVKANINDVNDEVSIKGIKYDSKMIKLVNQDNNIINYKLKLDTIDESKYNSNNLHSIYKENILDSKNLKIIINESAAYEYNLKIGDYIEIDPTEEATRYNNFRNADGSNNEIFNKLKKFNETKYKFKVVDIISTYQNPEFYINQRVANCIIGLNDSNILKSSFYNEYSPSVVNDEASWFNPSQPTLTINQIDPFNGFYTKSENPKSISSIVLYSNSGLAPANDKFINGDLFNTIVTNVMNSKQSDLTNATNQNKYISKIYLAAALGFSSVDDLDTWYQGKQPSDIINDLIGTYGQSPLLSSLIYVEQPLSFFALFGNISQFVNSIFILILVIILLICILAVFYLSIDFIYSSIALCGMLKAYGFKDSTNVFSFLSMFFPAIILALIISTPLSILTINWIKSFVYGFSGIFLPISLLWWYVVINAIVLFAILSLTILIAILILKREKITKLITRY